MEIATSMKTAIDQCFVNSLNNKKVLFSFVESQHCKSDFSNERNTYNPESCIPDSMFSVSTSLFSPASVISQETYNDDILISEKLKTIIRKLSLSKKGLCMILNISRPSLYSWLSASAEPEKENLKILNSLYSLIEKSGIEEPLFRGYVENPVNGYSESLLEVLKKQTFIKNRQEVTELIKLISDLSKKRQEKINKHRITENRLSNESKDLILEDNLNSI